jgi:hypothetical protein
MCCSSLAKGVAGRVLHDREGPRLLPHLRHPSRLEFRRCPQGVDGAFGDIEFRKIPFAYLDSSFLNATGFVKIPCGENRTSEVPF